MRFSARGGAFAVLLLSSTAALAQHADHGAPPAPPAAETQPPAAPAKHDHGAIDQGTMDHGSMNHGAMDHGSMNHGSMNHGSSTESHAGAEDSAAGSGTSRLPGAEGMMPGLHFSAGGWGLMAHGYLWPIYSDQGGPRGDEQAFVTSMAMLEGDRQLGTKTNLQLRAMLSLDPLIGDRGYPNLFATGETAGGAPLVDRQHPHDFFMELSARVDREVAPGTNLFLYGGPVAEPALGPSAFMHRASARNIPEAPITHHWFDSTHITFGVLTAGVAARRWQLEASAFRGREPDEDRWDIETPKLDSWSVRGTLNPTRSTALQVSYGKLRAPERLHPDEDEGRLTASAHYFRGDLAVTAAYSAKNRLPGPTLDAFLVEANYDLGRHSLFGRGEVIDNDELFGEGDPLHDRVFRMGKLSAGYAYHVPLARSVQLSLGGSASVYAKPAALNATYGENPRSFTLFAKLALGEE